MFSCEQVLAELSEYLDHELSAAIRKEIEDHMAHCKTCTAIYDSTRKTLRIVTDSGSFELSEDLSSRISTRIREKVRSAAHE